MNESKRISIKAINTLNEANKHYEYKFLPYEVWDKTKNIIINEWINYSDMEALDLYKTFKDNLLEIKPNIITKEDKIKYSLALKELANCSNTIQNNIYNKKNKTFK